MSWRAPGRKILVLGTPALASPGGHGPDAEAATGLRALREAGCEVVLIQGRLDSVLTGPELAHRTYLLPLHPAALAAVVERERPDAVLPWLGGEQAIAAWYAQDRPSLPVLGGRAGAPDRARFRRIMAAAGLAMPRGGVARGPDELRRLAATLEFPCVARLPGRAIRVVRELGELEELLRLGGGTLAVEAAGGGWRAVSLVLLRDRVEQHVMVGAVEQLEPASGSAADAWWIAPAPGVPEALLQELRAAAGKAMGALDVEGVATVRFLVQPRRGRWLLDEVSPGLAPAAVFLAQVHCYPLGRIATQVALGHRLDELAHPLTGHSACREPRLDMVAVRSPGFLLDHPEEALGFGRTWREACWKAIAAQGPAALIPPQELEAGLHQSSPARLWHAAWALLQGTAVAEVAGATGMDAWLLHELAAAAPLLRRLERWAVLSPAERQLTVSEALRLGLPLAVLAAASGLPLAELEGLRANAPGLVFKGLEGSAGELGGRSPYLVGGHEDEDELGAAEPGQVLLLAGAEPLGALPRVVQALQGQGHEVVLVGGVPGAQLALDTADRMILDPLSPELLAALCTRARPVGICLALAGAAAPGWARQLLEAGLPVWGMSPGPLAPSPAMPVLPRGARGLDVELLVGADEVQVLAGLDLLADGELAILSPRGLRPTLEARVRELARELGAAPGPLGLRLEVHGELVRVVEIRPYLGRAWALLELVWPGCVAAALAVLQGRALPERLALPRHFSVALGVGGPGPWSPGARDHGVLLGQGVTLAEALARALRALPGGWPPAGQVLGLGDLTPEILEPWDDAASPLERWRGLPTMLALAAGRIGLVLEGPSGEGQAPWDEARQPAKEAGVPWLREAELVRHLSEARAWERRYGTWRLRALQEEA